MLFLDESGYPRIDYPAKYPESDFFIVGGVLLKETNYLECRKAFNEFKHSNLPEPLWNVPLHANELNQLAIKDKSDFKKYMSPQEAKKLLISAYKFISNLPLEAIAVLVDNVSLREKYKTPADPYLSAYWIVVEKFQKIISKREEKENIFGVVNLSRANEKLSQNISKMHDGMIKYGTEYTKLETIFPKINIQPTTDSCFFEMADLVCYAYQRAYHAWLCEKLDKKCDEENYLPLIENLCKNIRIGHLLIDKKFQVKVFPFPRFPPDKI